MPNDSALSPRLRLVQGPVQLASAQPRADRAAAGSGNFPAHLPGADGTVWRDRLSQLLESTGEGIFGIDMAGCCTFINRAGAAQLGFHADEVLGLNMHELAHHTHADGSPYPEHLCPIFNAFRMALPCRIDTEQFWRRDGSAFAVEYSSYPIVDGGEVQGAVVTFVDISARKRAEEALRRANDELEQRVSERTHALSEALQQLRELSAYTHSVREDERTRIAREVHDELGSLLVALKMDVGWLDKRLGEQQQREAVAAQEMRDRMRSKCQNMGRLIEAAVDNVGRIITDLRPSILDHQGLWAALDWQAHEFVQSAEMTLDWTMEIDDGAHDEPLPESSAIAVFRIFQEMLSNVGRHAQATHLSIAIQASAETISIAVRDNGKGADASAFEAADAYGVMGMRERARHLGGSLEIWSTIGAGSLFHLRIQRTALPGPPTHATMNP
ncbi:MAG: PAS domain-containing sensor histidine kinase [Polaromonas sp.]|nr:PAS domain-containing sensor histidine kinase [Polaromonas sp.]